jgi:hypothetical protein
MNRSAAIPSHGRARARRLLQFRRGIPEILGRLHVRGHRAMTQGGLIKVLHQQWGLTGGTHTSAPVVAVSPFSRGDELSFLYSVVSLVGVRVIEEEVRLEGELYTAVKLSQRPVRELRQNRTRPRHIREVVDTPKMPGPPVGETSLTPRRGPLARGCVIA